MSGQPRPTTPNSLRIGPKTNNTWTQHGVAPLGRRAVHFVVSNTVRNEGRATALKARLLLPDSVGGSAGPMSVSADPGGGCAEPMATEPLGNSADPMGHTASLVDPTPWPTRANCGRTRPKLVETGPESCEQLFRKLRVTEISQAADITT